MDLKQKFKVYTKLVKTEQDKYGFVESDHCDSLLFTSLLGCVPGILSSVYQAKAGGRWFRRPISYPSCISAGWDRSVWQRVKDCIKMKTTDKAVLAKVFEKGNSTISRDMLLGLAWYAYHSKQLSISESVVKYALKNKGVMGDGAITKTFIGLGLLSTFAWISYKLGGPSRKWLRMIPLSLSKSQTGFRAHLQVLHGLLRSDLSGESFGKAFAEYAKRQPRNPLFLIANKEYDKAEVVLMCESYWPSDRLPTSGDRKTEWLPMRDEGDDWKPSEDGRRHSGGDFLFLAWLLTSKRSS